MYDGGGGSKRGDKEIERERERIYQTKNSMHYLKCVDDVLHLYDNIIVVAIIIPFC